MDVRDDNFDTIQLLGLRDSVHEQEAITNFQDQRFVAPNGMETLVLPVRDGKVARPVWIVRQQRQAHPGFRPCSTQCSNCGAWRA